MFLRFFSIDLLVNFRVRGVVKVAIVKHNLDVFHYLIVCTVVAEVQLGFYFTKVHRFLDDIEIVWNLGHRHWFYKWPCRFVLDDVIDQCA